MYGCVGRQHSASLPSYSENMEHSCGFSVPGPHQCHAPDPHLAHPTSTQAKQSLVSLLDNCSWLSSAVDQFSITALR